MQLKIEYVPINELKPYENNAKIHTAEQIEQIKNSIEQFGMNDPIAVWKDNVIIEGHGRLIACQELGEQTIPVIRLDKLTDEQRRAYGLIHNKLTMDTGFDLDILGLELENIDSIGMVDFGFNMQEMEFMDFEEAEAVEHSKRMNSTIVSVVIGFCKFEIDDKTHAIYEATKRIDQEKAGEILSRMLLNGDFE